MSEPTGTLNDWIAEYGRELARGKIQRAYRGILAFMSGLSAHIARDCPDYTVGALYQGYMDMSYFSVVPQRFKAQKLKIAVVYRHDTNTFEAWLSGVNRAVQARYIEALREFPLEGYTLSGIRPGVDSILEARLVETPDFDHPQALEELLRVRLNGFIEAMTKLVAEGSGMSAVKEAP